MQTVDVVINGGGMVGLATAVGLAQAGFSVTVIEKQPPKAFDASQPFDLRISAISHTSIALLDKLGAWRAIEQMRTVPYTALQTWEKQNPDNVLHFDSQSLSLDALGHMVENRVICLSLLACAERAGVNIIFNEQIIDVERRGEQVAIKLANESIIANLLIGADGANSFVRNHQGIGISTFDYRTHAMLITVTGQQAYPATTWQQFEPTGPKAILPLGGVEACLVWYDSPARIAELSRLSHSQLAAVIMQEFPSNVGSLSVNSHASFPLTRRHAHSYVADNIVLVGDAAHTINPLAGQGVNLGFKDVDALITLLMNAKKHNRAYWQKGFLQTYQQQRKADNAIMMHAMDLFYFAFSKDKTVLKGVRQLALKLAANSGPIKKWALRYALGMKVAIPQAIKWL